MKTKQIAFAAVMTAIAWMLQAAAQYSPVGIVLFSVASELAILMVLFRAGFLASVLSLVAVAIYDMLLFPIHTGYLFVFVFAPHILLAGAYGIISDKFIKRAPAKPAGNAADGKKSAEKAAPDVFGGEYSSAAAETPITEAEAGRAPPAVDARRGLRAIDGKTAALVTLRLIVVAAVFNLSFFLAYKTIGSAFFSEVLPDGLESYAVMAVVCTAVFAVYDLLVLMSARHVRSLLKKLLR